MGNSLPKNWVEAHLGDIAKLQNGYAFKSNDFKSLGDVPVIRISNIFQGKIDLTEALFVDKNLIKDDFKVQYGDILIAMSGATTGKYGVYSDSEISLLNQRVGNLKLLIPDYGNKAFLYYLLGAIKEKIVEMAYGGAQPNISSKLIESILVPLPPLGEQQRIVAKLDVLFGQLETIKKSLENVPVLLKNFRQQVLTQAVTGKLTEEWREGRELEDPKKVINEIANRRRIKSSPSLLKKLDDIYNDMSLTVDYDSPKEWLDVNLDKVCEKFSYGTSTKSDETGDFVVLRMGNLQNGKINWNDLKYTSDLSEFEKYKLDKGDVLFNRTNSPDLVGKTSIFEGEYSSIYAGYLIKIWNYNELNSYYLNYVMNSDFVRKWCWGVKSDGVSQSNINAQKLSKLTIPFPSTKEQQEIVRRIDSLFAKADAIEAQYTTLKEKIDKLPQAILHKAFKGELTQQLDTDGDARDLLKAIEKLKSSATKTKKSKAYKTNTSLKKVAEPK